MESVRGSAGAPGAPRRSNVRSVTPPPSGPPLDVRHVRVLPARPGLTAPWPDWLPSGSAVRAAVERAGIAALWHHQAEAAAALFAGHHVAITTGTASGKTLCYLLPIAVRELGLDPDWPAAGGHRPATSIYVAPTKALAHDQARVCAGLGLAGWRVATVDGDTNPDDRRWARDHAQHVLTNPDLLHASLLPNHRRWAAFLRSLRFVVVDESHRYRGVFGAQVAAVLRRLRRVAAHYGAEPAFALVSATAAEPVESAADLSGIAARDLVAVAEDGSARGLVRIALARAEPGLRSAAGLMAEEIRADRQVLAFVGSRSGAEELARTAGGLVGDAGVVRAYRAGYLAADRRVIERGLADRTIHGVAATNALELGVDIAGLDSVVLCGYPGSRSAFWQQAGRAGRRGSPADVVLLARPRPVDAYLLDHPWALFDQPVETTVLDPASPPVLGPQLAAAAQELPLRLGDERWFGPGMWSLISRLTGEGLLRRRPDGWYWTSPERAADRINLRGTDRDQVEIIEEPTGRVLGTVEPAAVDLVLHPGAVYLHQGETYLCETVDLEVGEAFVRAARPGYLTQPVSSVEVHLGRPERRHGPGGVLGGGLAGGQVSYGPARVSSRVTGFLRRDEQTGRVWDSISLACPERVLATSATAVRLGAADGMRTDEDLVGDAGVHALEHLLAGMLPAIVANDRADIGAHSWTNGDGSGTVAVFDRQPGSGFAARCYERVESWLGAAWERVTACDCDAGCPACVLAADCASDRPLDKEAARRLLAALLADRS